MPDAERPVGTAPPGRASETPVTGLERVRLLRMARGLSQDQLAREAGITRQAVTGIEAGRWDPSLRVALAIARALQVPVEELVGGGLPLRPVDAHLAAGAVVAAGARVRLAEVGGRLVAVPQPGAGGASLGFAAADAVRADAVELPVNAAAAADPRQPRVVRVRPIALRSPTLLVAGCDPAIPLLAQPLHQLDPPVELVWWPCGSERALELAAGGLVHAAGVHLLDRGGSYNRVGTRTVLATTGGDVVGFARWRQGWALGPGIGHAPNPLAEASRRGLRIVNREPGAEARNLLDRERLQLGIEPAQLTGYDTELPGHLPLAAAVAAGLADLGIASEPAVRTFGLAFEPLTSERFDLVLPRTTAGSVAVQGLLRVLAGLELRAQLAALPGYDLSTLGRVVDTF